MFDKNDFWIKMSKVSDSDGSTAVEVVFICFIIHDLFCG